MTIETREGERKYLFYTEVGGNETTRIHFVPVTPQDEAPAPLESGDE